MFMRIRDSKLNANLPARLHSYFELNEKQTANKSNLSRQHSLS